MTKTQKILFLIGLVLITAFLAFVIILYIFAQKSLWCLEQDSTEIVNTIGGIIGPIVGFFGVLITFIAFYFQIPQISLQKFENNFFELLKLHRENVAEFNYRGLEGRNVILKITEEFFEIMEVVHYCMIKQKINLSEKDLANISYTILFFGTDKKFNDILKNIFKKYSKYVNLINEIIGNLCMKEKYIDKYMYYNGHQTRLGHYYRHLIKVVLYVHDSRLLSKQQKVDYVNILRAQLSNYEQILLFFNSISDLGLDWELSKSNEKDKLITIYNLIKNIPIGSLMNFNPKNFYPNVEYEYDFDYSQLDGNT
jgi:hypothetical protein